MQYISTGISGLDEMLQGGFLKNRIMLVRGGPGAGKTIFSLQFILEGAKKGERGIYFTLEEPLDLIKTNIKSFKWPMDRLEKDGLIKLVDVSGLIYKAINAKSYESSTSLVSEVINQMRQASRDFGTQRLAIDPITSIIIHHRYPTDKRLEIVELIKNLRDVGCTSLITSESTNLAEGDFFVEDYLADGVIILSKTLNNFKLTKTLRIEKMRGTRFEEQPRKYDISEAGFKVYSTEQIT